MIHIGVLIIIITPAAPDKEEPIRVVPVAQAVQEAIKTPEPPAYVPARGEIIVRCKKCHWWKICQDKSTARGSLAGHRNWCNRV